MNIITEMNKLTNNIFNINILSFFVILILEFTTQSNCLAENDSIFFREDYILFQNKKYNKFEDGKKSGAWLEYDFFPDLSFSVTPSILENIRVKDVFRPLKNDEFNGIKILVNSTTDTINDLIVYNITYHRVFDYISPDKFYITAKGQYKNNKKSGDWVFFYMSGEIKKKITYANGLPLNDFKIFRENGSIMLDIIKLSRDTWEVCRYNELGEKISCEIKVLDEIKELY